MGNWKKNESENRKIHKTSYENMLNSKKLNHIKPKNEFIFKCPIFILECEN